MGGSEEEGLGGEKKCGRVKQIYVEEKAWVNNITALLIWNFIYTSRHVRPTSDLDKLDIFPAPVPAYSDSRSAIYGSLSDHI